MSFPQRLWVRANKSRISMNRNWFPVFFKVCWLKKNQLFKTIKGFIHFLTHLSSWVSTLNPSNIDHKRKHLWIHQKVKWLQVYLHIKAYFLTLKYFTCWASIRGNCPTDWFIVAQYTLQWSQKMSRFKGSSSQTSIWFCVWLFSYTQYECF